MTRDLTRPDGDWSQGFQSLNGIDLHYVREGAGRPIILLHGWPEFWWAWHKIIPSLAAGFDVIAPDLRGFGQSRALSGDLPDAEAHAADILALADALNLERVGLVGHDVGSSVLQQIAQKAPDRVSGLFSFNTPYPGIGKRWVAPEHVQQIWYQSFNQLPWATDLIGHSRETCRLYIGGMLRHWAYRPEVFDDQIEHWVDNFLRPGNLDGGFAWYKATHAARMAQVREGALPAPKITLPSRFFWGRHDPILLADWVDGLENYFTDPLIEIAEEAGHFVHLEQPEAASARILDFFQSL
ncbi:MAG: alpha/beta hydrolase [Pseudomonadota bacterium]